MLDYKDFPMFFLGCNSGNGFVSKFGESYNIESGWYAYIIKGGPGTGKSTFMKKIAKHAKGKGLDVILSPCTGDPDSLDAVIVPEKKMIIMDGTAPHIVEGKYIGAVERIVNIGDCFNFAKLRENRSKIIEISDSISSLYRRVYRYTSVTAALKGDTVKLVKPAVQMGKIDAFCRAFAKKHLKNPPAGKGAEFTAFLEGITCRGNIFFGDTAGMLVNNITAICDRYGVVSNLIVSKVRLEALKAGFDVITCPDPLTPDSSLRHIIIPGADIALITCDGRSPSGETVKKIHAKRFLDMQRLSAHRERIAFNRRAAKEINEAIFQTMRGCKELHDRLEEQYSAAVDFEKVNTLCEQITADIDSLPTADR